MLSNYIFGNWGGDEHNSYTGSSGGRGGAGAKIRDEEEKDLENTVHDLDELADRLLTQFPAYGTNHSHASASLMNQQDADWLLSGEDDNGENEETAAAAAVLRQQPFVDENGQPLPGSAAVLGGATATGASLLAESRLNQQHQAAGNLSVTFPASSATASKAMLPSIPNVTSNWDYDEQYLWKAVGEEKESHHEPRRGGYASASSNNQNRNGRSYLGLQEDPSSNNNQQQQPQQWMYGKNINYHHHEADTDRDQDPKTSAATKHSRPHSSQSGQANLHKNHPIDSSLTTATDADFYNSKQHWMPDQLCKECYACDTPFTVFRRRHHCRLCGQVFCSSCSAFFVPSQNQKKGNSTLRICQMCHEQVTQKGGLLLDSNANHKNLEDGNESVTGNGAAAGGDADTGGANSIAKHGDEITPEGRPIVTDHKTLTIQTSPSVLSSGKAPDPHYPDGKAAATVTAAAIPMVWMDREQSQEMSTQAHWQATVKQDAKDSTLQTEAQSQPSPSAMTTTTTQANRIQDDAKVDANNEARRHLGLTAANHLEMMGASLLQKDAPLLLEEIERATQGEPQPQRAKEEIQKRWLQKLMTLATRCCATVEPNVKKGDLLDIRPYVKIKVIAGGSFQDCAYLSGIVFRKTVSHKRMAKEIHNPKIMLLSGGIEFTRTENRIASLHTLLEQEGKYMELLVGRILKLKPDVLCVGRSVSRRALELFLKANVVLIQHVKSTLMSRISRQTGATIISSTDHIMNQFGAHVLGKCNRFRLVTFRDSEVWVDSLDDDSDIFNDTSTAVNQQRSIRKLLRTPDLANHERQAALAANVLGDGVVDGAEAVRCGLSKRGVAQTFVMLEGCPKHLGCSVVLRGASRGALKQVKRVFRFLVNVAYNLRLETCYLKERCARIRKDFEVDPKYIFSSSLCVDYGSPPPGRKMVRPWNGGSNETSQRSLSGEITAFDHQSILITSVWMTEKTQCCPAEVKGICYYSLQDVSLGQFLRDSCFNLSLKCQNPNCKKSVDDHSLLFVHKDGVIKITVEHMDGPLPPPPAVGARKGDDPTKEGKSESDDTDSPIATWTYCKQCNKVVTPLVYISENTWKFSFGKFLEVFFYNKDAVMNSCEYSCSCPMQTSTMLYFGCGKLAARFSYERVRPLGVFVRKMLPIDVNFHRREALIELERISMSSSKLFINFDKHIDKVTREARSLFGSAANRPEHLQTVLSELNRIGSEVDHAAQTLQEKIASVSDKCRRDGEGVVNEALFRFPWFSRRYLFMLISAWNERLTATGQAITAMRKLASSAALRGDIVMGPNGPAGTEELVEAMRRLRQLNEVYSRYNVTDITTVLPTVPGKQGEEDDDDFEDVEASLDFADGVDADVLASRRRLNNSKSMGGGGYAPRSQLHKTLGTQRSFESSHISQETSQPRVTPGGAVKSAITRFFNRGGRESDPYTVDLGIFKEGRPRLEPGVNGIVVPVVDEQLSTVIAYSLASTEYARQFKNYVKTENLGAKVDEAGRPIDPSQVDPSTGAQLPSPANNPRQSLDEKKMIEQRMLVRSKSHIKHTWRDYSSGERGHVTCKFVCTSYWATQFQAVRQVFLSQSFGRKDGPAGAAGVSHEAQSNMDVEQGYVQSLSSAFSWAASGGKSGASFARSSDNRFVIKCISRTELQMFLDCAPAYFEYLSKAFFHGLPTVLCKIVGVYQIGYHNRETGKRSMEQVAVMQNIFYNRKISKVFDLKGSLKGRFAAHVQSSKEDSRSDTPPMDPGASSSTTRKHGDKTAGSDRSDKMAGSDRSDADDTPSKTKSSGTQLDGDFLEFTKGRPMPLNDRAKSLFHMSIQNDTLFLSIINVLDYSILVGIDEEKMELVVGIIDFMRQYDILKQMERVGKSLPMVVGSEAPTIIQPPLYKQRFTNAMERYFMTVPCKWTTI